MVEPLLFFVFLRHSKNTDNELSFMFTNHISGHSRGNEKTFRKHVMDSVRILMQFRQTIIT